LFFYLLLNLFNLFNKKTKQKQNKQQKAKYIALLKANFVIIKRALLRS
jgi:hypothetical protein